ncbi:MAG: efflux RND transporter periplasmic adaptor subunit [Thiohalomonadales bacterium]
MQIFKIPGRRTQKYYFIALAILLAVSACGKNDIEKVKKEVVRPAKIITVGSAEGGLIRSFPAKVKASERSELAFRISGELRKLPIKAGKVVKTGQKLAQLDQTDYQLRLNDSKAKFDLVKIQYDRAEKLVKDRMIPISDFDSAKARYLTVQAELKLAQQNMLYTTLRAPYDGRISRVFVKNHENIKAQQPIMVIQAQDNIDLEFYVPESVIANAKVTTPDTRRKVDVKFDLFPNNLYQAVVKEFDTEVDPNTQSYRILVTMKRPSDIKVIPGMAATVIGKVNESPESSGKVILPVAAVFAAEDKALASQDRYVWKYDATTQQVSRHAVTVGPLTDGGITIVSGVSAGEQIVAAGVQFLKEKQKVKPLIRERGL